MQKKAERGDKKQGGGKESTPKKITSHTHSEENTAPEITSSYNRSDNNSAPLTEMKAPPTRDATRMSSFSLPPKGSKQSDKRGTVNNRTSVLLPKEENWISWEDDDTELSIPDQTPLKLPVIVHDLPLINEPQEKSPEQTKLPVINNYHKKQRKSSSWNQRGNDSGSRGPVRVSSLPEQTHPNDLLQLPGGEGLLRRYSSPHPLNLLQGRTRLTQAEIHKIEEWVDDDLNDIIYRFRDRSEDT